ncbi:carbohydrate kinase family protein [Paracidovorax anthurii]|uniref:Ribokinase n=1 Tax=Paracidovorax anthurii TaxID=78229 RepID=A0A328Z734_9BURK|nr:carbohydrate kinase family protein [Paracidovorax anthurii]RAR81005.1 ribokinase [Paracidovorax anthurii]
MRVTTIGGATVDIVVEGGRWPGPAGGKQDVGAITMGVGGGAVNACLAFRACGADARIVCALGCDPEAEWVRSILAREGVDVSLVQSVSGQPTGRAVIHLDTGGDVRIFAQRGASVCVSPSRALEASGQSDLLYVSALSAQAEAELDAALSRSAGQPPRLAVNPGSGQLQARSAALERVLGRADLVSVNEAEARTWASGRGMELPRDLRSDGAAWMARLRVHGGQALLVTLGAGGALFDDGAQVHDLQAERIAVRSSLGAGDAFAAMLAYHWTAGCAPAKALERARTHCGRVLRAVGANLAGQDRGGLTS